MPELTLEQIKALPKGAGHLFAKTRRFPPEDPRSTFDAWQVGVYSDDPETYSVHAVVQEPGYYSGITFEIKAGTANGTYPLGPSGIAVRYYVDAGEGIEFYYAIRGEIKLTTTSRRPRSRPRNSVSWLKAKAWENRWKCSWAISKSRLLVNNARLDPIRRLGLSLRGAPGKHRRIGRSLSGQLQDLADRSVKERPRCMICAGAFFSD
jgi:hypothetical protein